MTAVNMETLGCESYQECEEWYNLFKSVSLIYLFISFFEELKIVYALLVFETSVKY